MDIIESVGVAMSHGGDRRISHSAGPQVEESSSQTGHRRRRRRMLALCATTEDRSTSATPFRCCESKAGRCVSLLLVLPTLQ
ncbi:hypothetical protein GUJ93_ZPchr0001g33087 [Zizania palustris]|uniref:Uncharacterized protein n=1 Tax=Zizania palustris TaxID=103762 RepID=A0A8J5R9Y5_ZIZPA|nr:hypothetical protein GUJ93_ZPchr0001g33087 [Zizania palustris]